MQLAAAFAESLARTDYEAVGFIPRPRLEHYAATGQILIQTENDEPAGVLVFGNGWPTLRVYQAIVSYDARRRENGLALVRRLVQEAERRGCHTIGLWCADDLPANDFWRAAGFRFAGQRLGGAKRGRLHNRWVLSVEPQSSLGLAV